MQVRYLDLFLSFLKIGFFTFGGGYAMIALVEEEVVRQRGWVENEEFIDMLTLAQSIPGPIALNTAAFVGYRSRGYRGALAALAGAVLPSFAVILAVAIFFTSIRHNAHVEAAFKAMRPVVVALILAPIVGLMKGMNAIMIAVAIVTMALMFFFELSPVLPIVLAVVAGVAYAHYIKKKQK